MNSAEGGRAAQDRQRMIGDRYLVGEAIGRGGYGVVRRGHDTLLGREVALKEIRLAAAVSSTRAGKARSRMLQEARASAVVTNAHAITVYDIVEDDEDGDLHIVMELLDGRTLTELVEEEGPLSPQRAAAVGLQVLDALQAAHDKGVIHRDVKPGNVMVMAGDRAKLGDFGLASLTDGSDLTMTGEVVGTPAYMAPEQASGDEAGPPADLWGLGATLYYAVEANAPFGGRNSMSTMLAVVNAAPRPAAHAGPLAGVLDRLLAKLPEDRPGADELRGLLAEVADGGGTEEHVRAAFGAGPAQPSVPAPRSARADASGPRRRSERSGGSLPGSASAPDGWSGPERTPGGTGASGPTEAVGPVRTPGARRASGAARSAGSGRAAAAARASGSGRRAAAAAREPGRSRSSGLLRLFAAPSGPGHEPPGADAGEPTVRAARVPRRSRGRRRWGVALALALLPLAAVLWVVLTPVLDAPTPDERRSAAGPGGAVAAPTTAAAPTTTPAPATTPPTTAPPVQDAAPEEALPPPAGAAQDAAVEEGGRAAAAPPPPPPPPPPFRVESQKAFRQGNEAKLPVGSGTVELTTRVVDDRGRAVAGMKMSKFRAWDGNRIVMSSPAQLETFDDPARGVTFVGLDGPLLDGPSPNGKATNSRATAVFRACGEAGNCTELRAMVQIVAFADGTFDTNRGPV